ncbi:MAG: hypothetical protein HC869_26895, partial [Rhodospirillales bacterium]|nr:hypothetical protein [Rhodospirillales bacterium]
VGSKAAAQTWPTVAAWVRWLSGEGDIPEGVTPMSPQPPKPPEETGVALSSLLTHSVAVAGELAVDLAKAAAEAVVATNKSMRSLAAETIRTLPRLVRAALVLILFLFVLDMSDGLEDIWFHWPAAALGFFVLLWLSLVGHRKKQ